jgi:tetratricopeptide (TPR) repeat protein
MIGLGTFPSQPVSGDVPMASRRPLLVALIFLLLISSALAQGRSGTLRIRVTFPDGRACNTVVRVQLMGGASTSPVAEGYTNDVGMTEFNNLEIGNYHLIVSGEGVEETDSGIFEVDSRRTSQYLYVTVRPARNAEQANMIPGESTVSTADLNIPAKAAREFDKATQLMARSDWKNAIAQLNRALALYPKYAAAYNNLGVAYARLGDRPHEREALQKAVALHFAPAFVNLAKMAIADRDMSQAETLLGKATVDDPANTPTLILLANVELLEHHYDLAIGNCRKVHSLAHDSHALAHYIAARALEHEKRPSDAAAEFRTFLQEEPTGERAEAVRRELSGLQNQIH